MAFECYTNYDELVPRELQPQNGQVFPPAPVIQPVATTVPATNSQDTYRTTLSLFSPPSPPQPPQGQKPRLSPPFPTFSALINRDTRRSIHQTRLSLAQTKEGEDLKRGENNLGCHKDAAAMGLYCCKP